MPGTAPADAQPGPAWFNRFLGFFTKRPVLQDQNTFLVIVIDESGLTSNIALQHNYDTGFFVEQ